LAERHEYGHQIACFVAYHKTVSAIHHYQ